MGFVSEINARHFDGALSADVVQLLGPIDHERPEVHAFVERMCRQLRRQHIDARDFSELMAWILGNFLPKLLPGAWGGIVPPITQQGRHAAIDEYLAQNPWRPPGKGDRILDLGCGFPPITTMDLADRFREAEIVGADPSLGKYLVRDSNDDYAVFDDDARFLYFQPGALGVDRWEALYRDPGATRERFTAALETLRSRLPEDDGSRQAASMDGVELVRNPIAEFERAHLRFERRGFGSDGLAGFAAARCFNVLIYFDDAFRQQALHWLSGVLIEGGIFVSGADWSRSRYARYSVHRRENGVMVPVEFAFSIENLRPLELIAVFALHDDDHDLDLMSRLIGILRSDGDFRRDIDARMDELQAGIGFGARKPDGYLGAITDGVDPNVLQSAAEVVGAALEREGFAERAVEVLERNGFRSWVNCIGHIAIDPGSGP